MRSLLNVLLGFSCFGRLFSQISFAGFLLPFLSTIFGSIFDLFLDAAFLVRDVFHGVLCDWTPVFGPFLARLFTVHFISARFLSLLGMFHLSRGRIYSAGRV